MALPSRHDAVAHLPPGARYSVEIVGFARWWWSSQREDLRSPQRSREIVCPVPPLHAT